MLATCFIRISISKQDFRIHSFLKKKARRSVRSETNEAQFPSIFRPSCLFLTTFHIISRVLCPLHLQFLNHPSIRLGKKSWQCRWPGARMCAPGCAHQSAALLRAITVGRSKFSISFFSRGD